MATPVPAVLPDAPRRTTRPGGVEDRYRSLFVIGRGGMGSVEVALERGAEGFERVVALKRLLPEQARDPRHKEMFLREARLAALLKHPNVVHAFAFGELYGELFLAMEYVEGETLARVLAAARERGQGRLDPALVAFVLASVCDGLHAAHELCDVAGQPLHVVHRDVSPQNVMIAYEGHVKILDFGVAKFDTGGHETRTGEVKGKMAYMSPEQALGEKLDRRSDLFSVGAVLFECLAGRRMWGAGTDMDVMRRLALEAPPRLDEAVPGAPPALVSLHARLVAHDPSGRPDTAKDVADELRAYASSWPAPDLAAVRTWMQQVFDTQAVIRQERLTESLEQAAPSRVESLRKTLAPGAMLERPTMTEAVILRASERPGSPVSAAAHEEGSTRPARRGWLAVAGGVGVAVGIGLAATALLGKGAKPNETPEGVGLVVGAGTGTSATTAASLSSAIPSATAPATPPSTPTATPTAPAAASATAAPAPSSKRPVKPRGAPPSRLPDVDPTPF